MVGVSEENWSSCVKEEVSYLSEHRGAFIAGACSLSYSQEGGREVGWELDVWPIAPLM